MKETKAVPFRPQLDPKTGLSSSLVAKQVEAIIHEHRAEGWEFVSIENVTTTVKGNAGCFGAGASPDSTAAVQLIIFQR